jgi:hypothetical protein
LAVFSVFKHLRFGAPNLLAAKPGELGPPSPSWPGRPGYPRRGAPSVFKIWLPPDAYEIVEFLKWTRRAVAWMPETSRGMTDIDVKTAQLGSY